MLRACIHELSLRDPFLEHETNKAHVSDMVAAIALVDIRVGHGQVAVVGKRPPKSTLARNHIRAPGMHSPNSPITPFAGDQR